MEIFNIVTRVLCILIILYTLFSPPKIKPSHSDKMEVFWKLVNAELTLLRNYPEWEYKNPAVMKNNPEFQKIFTEYVLARIEYHIFNKTRIHESLIDGFLRFSKNDLVIEKCSEYFKEKERYESFKKGM